MTLDTLPPMTDRVRLIAELEAQAALIGADIEASKARIVTLKRDQRIVLNAVSALKRGDGLQPGLEDGDAVVRAVTHSEEPEPEPAR